MVPVHNILTQITRTIANQERDDSLHCMFDTFHLFLLDFPTEIIFNSSSEPSTRLQLNSTVDYSYCDGKGHHLETFHFLSVNPYGLLMGSNENQMLRSFKITLIGS